MAIYLIYSNDDFIPNVSSLSQSTLLPPSVATKWYCYFGVPSAPCKRYFLFPILNETGR